MNQINDFDPSFPNQLPEGAKKWEIPVPWLRKQICLHELLGEEVFVIAVDFQTQKLYLRGYGPEEIENCLSCFPSAFRATDYYERIPPDK